MSSVSIQSTGSSGLPPCESGGLEKHVDPHTEEAFNQMLGSETPEKKTAPDDINPEFRMAGWTGYATVDDKTNPINIDDYQPEEPDIPQPEEKPSNFLEKVGSEVKKGAQSVIDFLGKPEVAIALRVANVVFAGAMVVAAGVLFATGVGAPAAVAALALAGAAGLVMQLPIVHDTLKDGVTALMSPILGSENAEKLGPLATQFMISGLMIAIVASGGSAANAKGAVDAAVGVFKTMQNVFSGIAQLSAAGSPILQALGINVDTAALQQTASMFGTLGAFIPNLANLSEGLGTTLSEFLKNPNLDLAQKVLGSMKDVPDIFAGLINNDFLKSLGSIIDTSTELMSGSFDFKDLLNIVTSASTVLNALPTTNA